MIQRTLGVVLLILPAIWAALGETGAANVQAASTFTVNSTADVVDAVPGDGMCETVAGNGICTLRAAIQETNALPGTQTITLPNGTYFLTRTGPREDASSTGDHGM